jgi:hypothetical protein
MTDDRTRSNDNNCYNAGITSGCMDYAKLPHTEKKESFLDWILEHVNPINVLLFAFVGFIFYNVFLA